MKQYFRQLLESAKFIIGNTGELKVSTNGKATIKWASPTGGPSDQLTQVEISSDGGSGASPGLIANSDRAYVASNPIDTNLGSAHIAHPSVTQSSFFNPDGSGASITNDGTTITIQIFGAGGVGLDIITLTAGLFKVDQTDEFNITTNSGQGANFLKRTTGAYGDISVLNKANIKEYANQAAASAAGELLPGDFYYTNVGGDGILKVVL